MNERLKPFEEKMKKTIGNLDGELTAIRAGRANPNVLNKIMVDYYGTPTPIQQVANVSVPEARMIQIQPWESSLIKGIEKAILTSDLGLNPSNDGKVIRLVFPELTEERRKELVGEGEVFYDYLRNGLAIERKGSWHLETLKASNAQKIEATDLRIALPIPQSEIDANPNIQQNPR